MAAPVLASAATLELWPEQTSVKVGDTIAVRLLVASDQALNAVGGTISFPPDLLAVTSVSKASSVISLWVQDPTFSNDAGTVAFNGLVPNPGYSGDERRVITVNFRAKAAGTASVSLASGQVLANDGNGTDLLTTKTPATFTIAPAAPAQQASQAQAQPQSPAAETPAAPPAEVAVAPKEAGQFDWDQFLNSDVPMKYFLLYVAASALVFLWGILYYLLGLRIKIYRESAVSKASRKAEK